MSRRAFARPAVVAALLAALLLPVAGPAAQASEADRVARVAAHQIGDPWRLGREGPTSFDCSGLVWYAFKQAGLARRIGGERRTARGYWAWFAHRGRTSRHHGHRGDLVIWGGGRHIGIYLGGGRAISTLTSGVGIRGVHQLTLRFTTFLHVHVTR
ncbi:MAG: NlpC/P60 family protein [Chloroflexota bacterium]